jgi:LL-diaminopimelate aminotransferase
MFTWFPIPPNYTSSEKFCFDLLEKAGVVAVPGVSFGKEGEGYVRMALVQNTKTLQKAIKNIAESGIIKY